MIKLPEQKNLICSLLLFSAIKGAAAEHRYDCIIIGAGVAGLTAAKKLHEAQKNVLILEAKNRLGGRVHTSYDWGFATDLGASWIHGIHNNPLVPLANNRSVINTSYNNIEPTAILSDFALYDTEGKPISKQGLNSFSSLAREFLDYCQTHNKMRSYLQSFTAFTQEKELNEEQRSLLHYALENMLTYEFAENLSKLSPHAYSACESSAVSGTNALLPEGYFQIFDQFSEHIPINLNQIVREIDYGDDEVRVITQTDSFVAKQVIITIPLGALKAKTITFYPSLPKEKREAIAQLQMGNYEKLYLLFDQVFWDQDKEWIGILPKNKNEGFNIFNYYKYSKKPILIVFTSGELARKMEKGDITPWVMQHLRLIYGTNIPNPIKKKQTHWASDPFTRGSYSYLPIHVDKSSAVILAKPVADKLYFAGEATSTTDPSTVHGAYFSGLQAAKKVLDSSKKPNKDAF